MNLNLKAVPAKTYDAIVVGSGISGGWAAKELCQKGLRVLLLERGRNLEHITDYNGAMSNPWDVPHRGKLPPELLTRQPIQSTVYAWNEENKNLWVDDLDHPYNQKKPFHWLRGDHLGGRSLMWGRQSYRLSDLDFEANERDGHGVDWPIRYRDIAPWYDYVETFAGISGSRDGVAHLPDGQFLPPMQMNALEKHFAGAVEKSWAGRRVIMGRSANLTQAQRIHNELGRASCQFRNKCHWGCPYGAYFSSQSATLPAARATGRLTVVTDAVVSEILFDDVKQRAKGVRVIDAKTNASREYFAKVLFLNASTLGTTAILLNSVSSRFPNGFGNDSGVVGRYLMDHHYGVIATGNFPGLTDQYYYGRRANDIYVPRFRNLPGQPAEKSYLRGFAYQASGIRQGWARGLSQTGWGADYKEKLTEPGPWTMRIGAWGECLPYEDNQVTLNKSKPDRWGLPTLDVSVSFRANELAMRKDMLYSGLDMLEAAGMTNVSGADGLGTYPPGSCIHEIGTVRMGRDPKTSALNGHNQFHAVKNVFITDGSCMTSSACQNPSLTYMALTARAADFAVREGKKGNL